ncbi:universal stress protein [Pseudanabaena sp. PCC 6802]|uniref:universal stress protein n=1 Tax=Pseudanabaena sp. PCC 6802 TaxID=118173 RepID=UPI00034A2015|nr:universal stress protein [Pseudanabaena sp. PCC 6802]
MKLLVAIDGSEASHKALQKAIELAVPTQALVVLITVVEPVSDYFPKVMMPTGDWVGWQSVPNIELEKALMETGQTLLQKAESACQEAGLECQTSLKIGNPREVICSVVKDEAPDFLIMGSRGLGTVERLMLGSVSDYVVHHATQPVIVVR